MLQKQFIKDYTHYYNAFFLYKTRYPEIQDAILVNKFLASEKSDLLHTISIMKEILSYLDYGYDDNIIEDRVVVEKMERAILQDSFNINPKDVVILSNIEEDDIPNAKTRKKQKFKIKGFDVITYDLQNNDDYELISTIISEYEKRARHHLPELLKHKIPLVFTFSDFHISDAYASFFLGSKEININIARSKEDYGTKNISIYVKTLAHEMAHYIYFEIFNEKARKYWEGEFKKGIDGDVVQELLYDMDDYETLSSFLKRIKQEDPRRYVQIISIQDLYSPTLLTRTKGQLSKYKYHKSPVSEYGNQNAFENFAEVIGFILGFGTRSVLPELLGKAKVLFPNLRVSSLRKRSNLFMNRDIYKS